MLSLEMKEHTMQTEVLSVYHSRFDRTRIRMEREGEYYNLWVISDVKREGEVLSFDHVPSQSLVNKIFEWYREMENKNVSILNALGHLEKQDETIQKATIKAITKGGK
jgi:hypothetical protein